MGLRERAEISDIVLPRWKPCDMRSNLLTFLDLNIHREHLKLNPANSCSPYCYAISTIKERFAREPAIAICYALLAVSTPQQQGQEVGLWRLKLTLSMRQSTHQSRASVFF